MSSSTLTTGALAKAAGVGLETIRYYERIGLLPEPNRSSGGYRQYRSDDVRRVRFIRSAQELGFTLDEISELLELRVERGTACGEVAETADRVISRIDSKIRDLDTMRRALVSVRRACGSDEERGDCPILEAIEAESE